MLARAVRFHRNIVLSALLATATIGAGCKNEPAAPEPPYPPGPATAPEAFCPRFADVMCEARLCCSRPGDLPLMDCLTEQKKACEANLLPLLEDARAGYEPTLGGGYLDKMRKTRQACETRGDDAIDLLAMFRGTGEDGADCTPKDASRNELFVARVSCASERRCRLELRANGALRGTCRKASADGGVLDEAEVCSHTWDCAPERWCNLPSPWKPGLWGDCQPRRADGWQCGGSEECRTQFCGAGGTCTAPTPNERYCALSGGPRPDPNRDGGDGVRDGGK